MKSEIGIVAAFLFGIGCSHAAPRPQSLVAAASPSAAKSRPAYPQVTRRTLASTKVAARTGNEAIYFDFDSANLRSDDGPILQEVDRELAHNHKTLRIEGNCDERGTTEYNIALGDRRARQAKTYLERLGIPGKRIEVVSYGSERPKYLGHNENAWAKNRRDDFKLE
jgi:peptidoglycan-associated lipoprotein